MIYLVVLLHGEENTQKRKNKKNLLHKDKKYFSIHYAIRNETLNQDISCIYFREKENKDHDPEE